MNSSLLQQIRFKVLPVVKKSMLVFWDENPCALVELKMQAV